jgi:hypothetical protein
MWLTPHGNGLELGIASAELDPHAYRLLVLADGRIVRQWRRIPLQTGGRWVVMLPKRIARSTHGVEAYLYRLDKPNSLYRHVRIHPRSAGKPS